MVDCEPYNFYHGNNLINNKGSNQAKHHTNHLIKLETFLLHFFFPCSRPKPEQQLQTVISPSILTQMLCSIARWKGIEMAYNSCPNNHGKTLIFTVLSIGLLETSKPNFVFLISLERSSL